MFSRLRTLYETLLVHTQPISIEDLASSQMVSKRTIYSDINRLNYLLRQHSNAQVVVKKACISLQGSCPVSFDALIQDTDIRFQYSDSRRTLLAQWMLCQPGFFSIATLMNEFAQSRNTIKGDLSFLREDFLSNGFTLESEPFKGNCVVGDERKIREYLAKKLTENQCYSVQADVLKDLDSLRNYVLLLEDTANIEYTDDAVDRLVFLMLASVLRFTSGHTVTSLGDNDFCKYNVSSINQAIRGSSLLLSRIFQTNELPNEEIQYLSELFSEARVLHIDEIDRDDSWLLCNIYTRDFIFAVAKNYPNYQLEIDDDLFVGLLNHIRLTYILSLKKKYTPNPLRDSIQDEYGEIYSHVLNAMPVLENGLNTKFGMDEASFLTLFFAAALERRRQQVPNVYRVIIVCSSGISTSLLVKAKIETLFNLKIIGIFSSAGAMSRINEGDIDLVISTVPFTSSLCRVVVVSPLLTNDDIANISALLSEHSGGVKIDNSVNHVAKKKYFEDTVSEQLHKDSSIYYGFDSINNGSSITNNQHLEFIIDRKAVEIDFCAHNWQDAVKESGRLLVKIGKATQSYTSAMVSNIEANGPYVVIAPGIAMPHADPKKGALGSAISILKLSKPVSFGHLHNDPVWLVIGIVSKDHHSHIGALKALYSVLKNEGKRKKIFSASTSEELIHLINDANILEC